MRYWRKPATIQTHEIEITDSSNIIKTSPNSSSSSRIVKNEEWVNKKMERTIASGASIRAETDTPLTIVLIFDI